MFGCATNTAPARFKSDRLPAVIDSKKLLEDLQREVTKLEDDLRARCDAEPTVDAPLKARYDEARARNRTALTYKAWREE